MMTLTRNEMSKFNSLDNNRRCKRTASKLVIVKDGIEKQSKFWIFDDCFNEKMYIINCSKKI
jgi:hypothetical protein